ncbi:hypothetical protein VTN49DRAFT_2766 [Thermomyces lanuginosus]|uniref:uncharacterized protein n=1 Tax=Thermomyces lanuginosus TaxID=5541 RepID=UPI00374337FD
MASFIRPSAVLRPVTVFPTTAMMPYSTRASPVALTLLRPLQRKNPMASQIALFHASGKRQILPALPQVIKGTMNDAAPVPPTSPTHGSYHWTFERIVAASLVPLTIAPFAAGTLSPVMDSILCATLVIHSHIGLQTMITDYFPTRRVPKTRAALTWILRASTLAVAVGLYEFETNDVGLTEAIKRVWTA